MTERIRRLTVTDCDYYGNLPPKTLMEECLSTGYSDLCADGLSFAELYNAAGAVWMLAHFHFIQLAPSHPGDRLHFSTRPRYQVNGRYVYQVDADCGDAPRIASECSFIPVRKAERHILRLNAVEQISRHPTPVNESGRPPRLRPDCSFTDCGRDTVRLSDTDLNQHMTSGVYFALACNYVGFWEQPDPVYMKEMQVDFLSEVRAGTELCFQRGEANGVRYVRGRKPDGRIAFYAACRFAQP